MRCSSLLLFALLVAAPAVPELKLIDIVSVNGRYITSDHLGNFYVIDDRNGLKKYFPGKKVPAIYNTSKYGKLKYVDATNPMRILLFYPEFETIIVLGNDLSELGVLKMMYEGISDISAIGLAQDNNIWLYDNSNKRLKKINDNGGKVFESGNLMSLGMDIAPVFIHARDQWVYLSDPMHGILVFDNYATYYKTIPLRNIHQFQVIGDKLYYFQNKKLKSYHLQTLDQNEMEMPIPDFLSGSIQRDRLFLLDKKVVYAYLLE